MGTTASPNLRIPTLSPSAFPMALPSVIATSSTMWCWRSPFALTVTSIRLCVASECEHVVEEGDPRLRRLTCPVPSRLTRTVMSVSFVFLVTSCASLQSLSAPLALRGQQ